MSEDLKVSIGGQAVIEGVMMRSPKCIATVVRRKDGSFENKKIDFEPITNRIKILKLPILRGFVNLVDTLKVGIETLNWSADIAIEDEKKEKAEKEGKEVEEKKESTLSKIFDYLGTAFILVAVLGLFMYVPYLISDSLESVSDNQFLFNLLAGAIRIVFLILYMYAISFMPDVRRVFEYHGAEHKSIFNFEKRLPMTVDNVRKQSRFHPRCGTSFILIVAINTIILYAILDSIIVANYGDYPNILTRVLVHLGFIPLVAGISYEILKLSDKFSNIPLVGLLIKPGVWLQHITTREPDDEQIMVAIESVKLSTDYLNEDDKIEGD